MKRVKVGLLGCGTVGGGVVRLLRQNGDVIRRRTGIDLSITSILVRDPMKERPDVDDDLVTTDPRHVVSNGCDIVVEAIGGIAEARAFIGEAIERGKHVATANKSLLALCGAGLFDAAAKRQVRIGYEASVCGALPIIRILRSGLAAQRVTSLRGVLNGTSNFILTLAGEERMSFDDALAIAQSKGFAEADPSLDVDGVDAAQKLKILAELAFGTEIDFDDIEVQGIRGIDSAAFERAAAHGQVIRHVATATRGCGGIRLSVVPEFLPASDPLARARYEENCVVIDTDAAGEMSFYGKGAGSLPTASALLADVIELART
jgi:homoserine dehydrogenase